MTGVLTISPHHPADSLFDVDKKRNVTATKQMCAHTSTSFFTASYGITFAAQSKAPPTAGVVSICFNPPSPSHLYTGHSRCLLAIFRWTTKQSLPRLSFPSPGPLTPQDLFRTFGNLWQPLPFSLQPRRPWARCLLAARVRTINRRPITYTYSLTGHLCADNLIVVGDFNASSWDTSIKGESLLNLCWISDESPTVAAIC